MVLEGSYRAGSILSQDWNERVIGMLIHESLILEALGPVRPRWWGDFNPSIRGPITYARLGDYPIPLPSTLVGALITSIMGRPEINCDEELLANPLACQEKALDLIGIEDVKGPFLGVLDNDELKVLVPIGGRFLSLPDGDCYEVTTSGRMGVALEREVKAAKEGYLYIERIVWSIKGLKGHLPYTLISDITLGNLSSYKVPKIIFIGGERQAFIVKRPTQSVSNVLESLWNGEWSNSIDALSLIVSTPVILHSDVENELLSLNPNEAVGKAIINEFLKLGIKVKDLEIHSGRCLIAGLGLGYDMSVNKPRPYKPAILPGCIISIRTKDRISPFSLYRKGLGTYTRLGWGTVVPVRKSLIPEKVECPSNS